MPQHIRIIGMFSRMKLVSGLLLLVLVSACEAMPPSLIDEGNIRIQIEEAESISIVRISIISEKNETILNGEAIAPRWHIVVAENGHIDFDVVYPNGSKIRKRGIELRRRITVSHGPRRLYFFEKLAKEPPKGTKVDVYYHTGSHDN